ncbi:MAG: TetR family transcriptional regulator [Rhodobacteraceae bacterium]|nr:TetR family transcriptional regulator [Paracoccaceae bacterium]MBR9820468.1 TetR family transcriptional regulator [Paracoccaceae bacterium]
MGRPRKHDQEAILDAVARVIARDGTLSLGAVAAEAGVAKATVLYDHASKRDLLRALVQRTIAADNAFNAECASGVAPGPDAPLRGRIEAARRVPVSEEGNPAVLGLIMALMQEADLRADFRDSQAQILSGLMAEAANPAATRLAWLALEGLKYQQHMALVSRSEAERLQILDDIETLARTGQVHPAAVAPGQSAQETSDE